METSGFGVKISLRGLRIRTQTSFLGFKWPGIFYRFCTFGPVGGAIPRKLYKRIMYEIRDTWVRGILNFSNFILLSNIFFSLSTALDITYFSCSQVVRLDKQIVGIYLHWLFFIVKK